MYHLLPWAVKCSMTFPPGAVDYYMTICSYIWSETWPFVRRCKGFNDILLNNLSETWTYVQRSTRLHYLQSVKLDETWPSVLKYNVIYDLMYWNVKWKITLSPCNLYEDILSWDIKCTIFRPCKDKLDLLLRDLGLLNILWRSLNLCCSCH